MAEPDPQSPLKTQPEPRKLKSLRSGSKVALKTREFNLIPLDCFNPAMLPTNGEVLRRCFFLQDETKSRSIKSIAEQVFHEMEDIYKRAFAIERSTKQGKNCIEQICKLHEDYRNSTRNYNPTKKQQQPKVQLFLENLHKMCDIAPKDAVSQINKDRLRSEKKKAEDIAFLNDQRNDRTEKLAKEDSAYTKKSDAKASRDSAEFLRNSAASSSKQKPMSLAAKAEEPILPRLRVKPTKVDEEIEEEDSEIEETEFRFKLRSDPDLDPDFQQSPFLRELRNSKQKKEEVSIAKDPLTLQALDRTKTSSRSAARILAPASAAMGLDVSKAAISRSTIERERKKLRSTIDAEAKAAFLPPENSIVHFDGKHLMDMAGEFGDRLAIVLSGNTPDCIQGKLLSAEKIADGTGRSQAEEVISALNKWGAQDNVCGMCFDTTSSNTGWIKGACVLIEEMLGRPLLWLPCRHHICELLLKAAWEAVFGEDMEPSYTEMGIFQKNWEKIEKNNFEILNLKPWMKHYRAKVVPFLKSLLQSKQPRDDYREVIELVLLILGSPVENFTFKKPGAYHKARWMAPLIYGCKMFLFRKQLKTQLKKDKKFLENLERFTIFATLFYVEHWFAAPLAAEAPYMDLKLYKEMLQFQKYDSAIATAVVQKFMLHTWYLNQEYTAFSLFSKNISDKEKSSIAKKLSKVTPPKKYESGYPMPVQLPQNKKGLDRKLSDSVMDGSLFLFDKLGFAKDWLYMPVTTWETNENFCKMRTWVLNLRVTNDCAERGVKLISDYAKCLTKDSVDRQNLLQVVSSNRNQFPDANVKTFVKGSSARE